MTVIKGKQTYSFPTSGNNSDVESLNLGSASASDTESINNEPNTTSRPFVPAALKSSHSEELILLKKCSGRKKLRRFQNRCLLQTLAEEEEDEGALVVIMEPYKSPFTKLLEDDNALEFWNVFVDKSEEEQAKVIEAFSYSHSEKIQPAKEKSLGRISHKIKRSIKVRKNLSLEQVKKSEDDLISFFKATPWETYTQYPPTYFARLLLHAIAQYHGLQSLGMIENGSKKVDIYSTAKDWIPAECFLTDFVAQLRK